MYMYYHGATGTMYEVRGTSYLLRGTSYKYIVQVRRNSSIVSTTWYVQVVCTSTFYEVRTRVPGQGAWAGCLGRVPGRVGEIVHRESIVLPECQSAGGCTLFQRVIFWEGVCGGLNLWREGLDRRGGWDEIV